MKTSLPSPADSAPNIVPSTPASTGESAFGAKPAEAKPYRVEPQTRDRPTLCLDFDGVIHSYEKGWQDGVIYGKPTKGFFEWADVMRKYFTLAIFSSRSDSHKNIKPMQDWLKVHLWDWKQDHPESDLDSLDFHFAMRKPAAFITIDDRALTFTGNWDEFTPERLTGFKPWNITPKE
jgi:hypothetical protein